MKTALVSGAGGFIGHHLCRRLKEEGYRVHGVDRKPPEYAESATDNFTLTDLRDPDQALHAAAGVDEVYNLAADMGGIGFISGNRATISRNNSRISLNMLEAARQVGISKFFFASSACVYAHDAQVNADVTALKEADAHPAAPERGYGWEKLWTEQLCDYYADEFGLNVRVGRFHNVYGPLGTYDGGREKAPAAACRKVALANDGDVIPVWGDGQATRSFMYIDDCLEGVMRLMASDYNQPLNIGSDELVTVDELYLLVFGIARKKLQLAHDLTKPQGVRGRNSDNTKIKEVLDWAPSITLRKGLEPTYNWIASRLQ